MKHQCFLFFSSSLSFFLFSFLFTRITFIHLWVFYLFLLCLENSRGNTKQKSNINLPSILTSHTHSDCKQSANTTTEQWSSMQYTMYAIMINAASCNSVSLYFAASVPTVSSLLSHLPFPMEGQCSVWGCPAALLHMLHMRKGNRILLD